MNEDINIIKMAMENEKSIGASSPQKSLIIAIYNIFMCLFNKYRSGTYKKIFVVNGRAEVKFENQHGYKTLYYAKVNGNLFTYRNIFTHVSVLKRRERIKAIVWAFLISKTKKSIKFGYVLDYLLWKKCFVNSQICDLCGSGHYDRLTTQLAYLASANQIKFTIKQHGLISADIHIQHKLPVNYLVAFDENEAKKFKKNIVANNNCIYSIHYECGVRFVNIDSSQKIVGIIENPINEMDDIIKAVMKRHGHEEIHLMLHPLSMGEYEQYKNDNFIIEKTKKIKNCDCIYAGSSTLVYDYLRTGYKGRMIVLDSLSVFCGLDEYYSNISIFKNLNEYIKAVENGGL